MKTKQEPAALSFTQYECFHGFGLVCVCLCSFVCADTVHRELRIFFPFKLLLTYSMLTIILTRRVVVCSSLFYLDVYSNWSDRLYFNVCNKRLRRRFLRFDFVSSHTCDLLLNVSLGVTYRRFTINCCGTFCSLLHWRDGQEMKSYIIKDLTFVCFTSSHPKESIRSCFITWIAIYVAVPFDRWISLIRSTDDMKRNWISSWKLN